MKIFIFSDSHLYNRYDKKFYNWVKYWSEHSDRVIICGDFWDKYLCGFDKFVSSHWKDTLFPILKAKKTHYIFGNHDEEEFQNDRTNLFSDSQSLELDLESNGKVFHFEHGHRFTTPLKHLNSPLWVKIQYIIQVVGTFFLGTNLFISFKRQIDDVKGIWGNEKRFLICGHTHYGAEGDNFYVLNPSAFGMLYGLMIEDGNLVPIKGYEKRNI